MGAAGTPFLLVHWSDQTISRYPRACQWRITSGRTGGIRLTGSLLDHVREVPMHGRIVGQLGMKRGDENAALAGHHAFPAVDDEGGDGRPHSPDAGGPDEDHLERLEARAEVGLPFRLEALLLPAI